MTRIEFWNLSIEDKGAIFSFFQARARLRGAPFQLLPIGAGCLALLLFPVIYGSIQADTAPAYLKAIAHLAFSHTLKAVILATGALLGTVIAGSAVFGFLVERQRLAASGFDPGSLHGLTDRDVFELFVIPQLESQGGLK